MAIKISDSLLQSIANPKWSEDLGRVGQGLAQAPYLARKEAREKERQRQKLLTLNAYERGLSNVDTTADQRADVLSGMLQLGTEQNLDFTPEDINALRAQAQQNRGTTRGSAFKSAVLKKARDANKPEDVTLIQSLDPVQDREMLIQYFRTGTFSKPGDNVVVVGNHLYDRKNEKWISGPKTGQKEKRKLLKVEFGTGDNKRVRFFDDQTGEQIGEDIVAPDSKDKNSAETMNKIHEANFYLGKKIGPALELLTQSKKDGLLSFDTGGTDAYIKEFFPESNEYKLKNNYYQSLASKEAFNSLEDLRIQAMEAGAKGSGLGQITQNEFRALKDVLTRLDQRATIDQQIESLQEIEQRYKNVLRLAAGESPIEILDWDSEYLIESGYTKHEGKVYYKPAYGPSRGYNPDTDRFEILTPRK